MSARIAFVSAALLVVSGAALSQPQPKPGPVAPPNTPLIPPPSVPLPSVPAPPPREKTVDELLAELEQLQTEKAALEKREQALKAALVKKLEAQAERLKKLGVGPQADKVGRLIIEGSEVLGDRTAREPDRIGKIIIEGNAKTPDEKILKLLELQPGQVLPYPALEAARKRLEKAGFRDVSVGVVPTEPGAEFKDVRVKITEADKR